MKRNIITLLALMQVLLLRAQITVFTSADFVPGTPIDTVQYVVGYDMAYVSNPSKHPYKPLHEQMTLEIGSRSAFFYSYVVAKSDSLAADVNKKGGNQYSSTGKISWRMYTDYPAAGQYQWLDRFGMDRFIMTERRPEIKWTLSPDSTATILGYTCRRATATVLGREWAAWYTEDIPLDRGPWLLSGLPGLILRAESTDSCYRFEADGIVKGRTAQPLLYKGGKYEQINRKTFASVYHRYFSDPIGYITNNPNVKVVQKDDKGNVINKREGEAYNLPDRTLVN